MSVISTPSMKGYTPPELTGKFIAEVDEVKPSSGDKGQTIFMTLVDASDASMDQTWQGKKVMYWFGTDLDQATTPWQKNSWRDKMYLVAEAFKQCADEIDTDVMAGERVGVNLRTVKKDGAINIQVDGIFAI